MKATIRKEDLQVAIKAINKIAGKPEKIYFLFNEDDTASTVVNSLSYFKYTIPAKDVKPGKLSLQASLFENLLLLRKAEISFSKTKHVLEVNSGTKHKLHCSSVNAEDIEKPDFKSIKNIKLKSKGVGIFKKMICDAAFYPVDEIDYVPVNIVNTKDEFVIGLADSVHCIFLRSNISVSDKPFSFMTNLKTLKDIFSFLDSNTKLSISDNSILISSVNIDASLPSLQEGGNMVKNAYSALPESNYTEGKIVFDNNKLIKWIDSLSVTCEGADLLKLNIKGKKLNFKLKTSFGVSEDNFTLLENTIGNKSLSLPLIMFVNILNACSHGKNTTMKISKKGNFYKLTATNKQYITECIAPVASIS